ncbi:hypothetical protein QTO34_003085 [Cnephaeus nilssonii]|uniref:Uncharacterized protein n=1 Tax=Cnephaeus nilssonii TaxID=3371016 RepID=A0AA40HU69_CNENI|nr:hypothetical protein QTO34_003085 [Eptesicus nilssonii]
MGVLTQPLGPAFTPVAYLSRQLDPTVQGWQPCLRALAAAAALTKEAQKICLQERLQDLLSHRSLSLLAPSRMQEFHLLFLESPDISLTQSPALNPATLLPAASTQPVATHSCPEVVETLTQPRAELADLPLYNPDLTLFVDGSSCLDPQGRQKASYEVVTLERILEAARLPEGPCIWPKGGGQLLREHADRFLPRPEPADQGSRGPPLEPGDSVLLKNLHPKALEPSNPHNPHCGQTTGRSIVAPPLQTQEDPEQHNSINVRSLGNLHPPTPAYVWRFKVRETYDQDSTQVTRQRNPDRCNRDVNTYGGCHWSGCVIHDAYNEVRSGPFLWKDGTFNIRVRDPWDQRWVAGVMGKLYGVVGARPLQGPSTSPGNISWPRRPKSRSPTASYRPNIPLKGSCLIPPRVEVLSSWLQFIQHTLLFLNETHTLPNVSHCFLCVSLQRPLLAAVPLMTPPGTQGHGECQPPLAGIPLWEPKTPEPPCPTDMLPDQQAGNCGTGHLELYPKPHCSQSHKASSGTFFWCNGTLSNCINSSDPGPCFGVTVVPQLTLYGESELAWLLPFHPTPGPAGPPSSLSCWGPGVYYRLLSLPAAASNIGSPNSPAEPKGPRPYCGKGGTCMFLQEECCCYINESGVVEQNVQTLTELSEDLRARHSRDNSLSAGSKAL